MLENNNKGVIKISVTLQAHRTSISLEEPFYAALKAIAKRQQIPLAQLVAQIDQQRIDKTRYSLSAALRVFVLEYYQGKQA